MSLADAETSEETLERLMLEDIMLFEVSEVGDWAYCVERRRKEEEIERKDAEWEEHLKNEEEKKKGRGRRRERGRGPSQCRISSESDEEEEADTLSPAARAERIRKNRELASKYMNQNESWKFTNEYLMNQYNRHHKRKAQEKVKEKVDWKSTWSSDSESVPEPEEREFVPKAVAPKQQPRQSESSSAVKSEPEVISRKAKKNRRTNNAMLMALEKKKLKDQPNVSDVPNSTNKKGGQAGTSQKKLDDGSESAARLTAILLGKESGTVVKPVQEAQGERLDVTERFKSFRIGGTEDDDDSKGSVCSSSSSYFTASSSGAISDDKEHPSRSSKSTTNDGTLCTGDSTDVCALESKKKVMHTTSKRVRRLPVKVPLSGAPPAREFRFNPPAERGQFNIKSSSDFPTL